MDEKKIRITVMDRSGHRQVKVDFDGAVDMCRQELSKGKWLRVITTDGKDYVIQQVEEYEKNLESVKHDILNGVDITLMAGLKGGNCGRNMDSCLADSCAKAPEAQDKPENKDSGKFRFDSEGYDRDGYDSEGYDRDGYDEEGYNMDGYGSEGYDRDGYDKEGYNMDGYGSEGYDRDGYDKDGYDSNGYNADGKPKVGPKVGPKVQYTVKVVKDPASKSLICVTADTVTCNNAYGKEVFADAAARLLLALNGPIRDMMQGKAVVVDEQG